MNALNGWNERCIILSKQHINRAMINGQCDYVSDIVCVSPNILLKNGNEQAELIEN